jgi:hypothetical protein
MKTIWVTSLLLSFRLLAATDPATLATELRRLGKQLDEGKAPAVRAALPPAWEVATPEGARAISTAPLRKMLENPDPTNAKAWLTYRAAHFEGYSKAADAPRDARANLERILARREFAGIGPPSAWELLRERITAWIANILETIFAFVGANSTIGAIFWWTLLAGAVGALGFLLIRRWTRDEQTEPLISDGHSTGARTSHAWIRSARALAGRGDWRKAIQCAYWAGIVRMEETGALPRDRAQTPREHLQLLAKAHPVASEPFAKPLAALTTCLERFWYARAAAGEEEFAACLDSLEALGCRVR